MLNAPPTYARYASGLVFQWLLEEGGLGAIAARNDAQATRVNLAIDQHELYTHRVHLQNRSRMNIPCQLTNEILTNDFLGGASSRDFVGLKGHKPVGGLRASLYNAVTDQAADALVDYLNLFAEQHA